MLRGMNQLPKAVVLDVADLTTALTRNWLALRVRWCTRFGLHQELDSCDVQGEPLV